MLPPADVIDGGVSAEDLPNCRKCECFSRRRLCRGSQQKRPFFNGFRALWLALWSNASVPSRPSLIGCRAALIRTDALSIMPYS